MILSRCADLEGVRLTAAQRVLESEHQLRWLSVGTLSLLRTGDVWLNGSLAATPEYEVAAFHDLLIDRSTATLIKAGFQSELGGFLLPFDEHPWHMFDTHSKCVLIELPDQRMLVVPCIEIIRFYFGSSSDLLSRLFSVPFTSSDLFLRVDRSVSGYRMMLDLAEGIPRASATDVARIAGSQEARRAAAQISTSCARASAAGREVYPSTQFPFRGRTDLAASGQWLGANKRTFLVYSLRSCSHPFPFRMLRYRLGAQTSASVRLREADAKRRFRKAPSPSRCQETLREQEPSARLERSEWLIARLSRFPDLERKSISTCGSHTQNSPTPSKPRESSSDVGDVAFGVGIGRGRIRPITLSYIERTLQSAPTFLRVVLSALQEVHGVLLTHLTGDGEDGWTVSLPLAQPDSSAADANSGKRRVAGFVLQHSHRTWFLLVAIECDPVCILLHTIPFDERGNAVVGHPTAVRMQWVGYLSPEKSDLSLDVSDEGPPEQIGAWIRERIAVEMARGTERGHSDGLVASFHVSSPTDRQPLSKAAP